LNDDGTALSTGKFQGSTKEETLVSRPVPLGSLLPGILCNDTVVKLDKEGDTDVTPTPAGVDGDIELGNARSSPSANEVYTVSGDPTESCIVSLAVGMEGGAAVRSLIDRNPRLDEIPFDSSTKYMATLHEVDVALCRDIITCATNADANSVVLPGT